MLTHDERRTAHDARRRTPTHSNRSPEWLRWPNKNINSLKCQICLNWSNGSDIKKTHRETSVWIPEIYIYLLWKNYGTIYIYIHTRTFGIRWKTTSIETLVNSSYFVVFVCKGLHIFVSIESMSRLVFKIGPCFGHWIMNNFKSRFHAYIYF